MVDSSVTLPGTHEPFEVFLDDSRTVSPRPLPPCRCSRTAVPDQVRRRYPSRVRDARVRLAEARKTATTPMWCG
jgi:hypothetical protein